MNSLKYPFKYLYGPVSSWRLGSSLGIDLLSQRLKVCNFNCIYCQLGRTPIYETERKVYVSTDQIINEIKRLPEIKIDFITFSGRGEPTLAKNLGKTIKAIRKIRKEPIAILTNSFLLHDKTVREEVALADFIVAKLDACSQKVLEDINQPEASVTFEKIVQGLQLFRKEYPDKKLALQMMFIDKNKNYVDDFVKIINSIHPDEIQINTPLRISPIKPLSKEEILEIKNYFSQHIISTEKINIVTVYDEKPHKKVQPFSCKDTQKRRGG